MEKMASLNQYYGSRYQFQQNLGSFGAFSQINGGSADWNSTAHTAFTPFSPATPMYLPFEASNNSTSSTSSEEDDWESVQTNFCSGNNHSSSVSSGNSNSAFDEEEWILDDASNQVSWNSSDQLSPGVDSCPQFLDCEENIDEGFQSQENAGFNQHACAGQEEYYDDECYMGNGYYSDNYAVAEDIEEDIAEPEVSTPFVKKPVKRDWSGNVVFQDDWNLAVKSTTGSSSNSSYSVSNGDEDVRTILKRRCNRSMF